MNARVLILAILATMLAAEEIDWPVVRDPSQARIPDVRSGQAWTELYSPMPRWVSREVATLEVNHPELLPTLWTARLLYRGDPWRRHATDPYSDPRWRAADREVKLAILRDARWRRDPALVPGLEAFLASENTDAGLVVGALAAVWMTSQARGVAAAARIADPRRSDRLLAAGLPGARTFALRLLLDGEGAAAVSTRGALEWALLHAEGSEHLAALAVMPRGAVPDLIATCLQNLAEAARSGRLDDDGTAIVVLSCSRLGDSVGEIAVRSLAWFAANAPREVACAAAAALARSYTWQNTIDSAPLVERVRRETDPAIRHALLGVLLRLSPARIAGIPGAEGWAALARHRKILTEWEWQQYLK